MLLRRAEDMVADLIRSWSGQPLPADRRQTVESLTNLLEAHCETRQWRRVRLQPERHRSFLTRQVRELTREAASSRSTPLVLLLTTTAGEAPIQSDEESRAVQEALAGSRFRLRSVPAARWDDLGFGLPLSPSIVHFAGHGLEGSLLFSGSRRIGHEVPYEDLAGLLDASPIRPRCLVLMACSSAVNANALYSSAGCIIGAEDAFDDGLGTAFSRVFYRHLAGSPGASLQDVFTLARQQFLRGDHVARFPLEPVLIPGLENPAKIFF